jgi:hypothetical protein
LATVPHLPAKREIVAAPSLRRKIVPNGPRIRDMSVQKNILFERVRIIHVSHISDPS